MLVGIAAAGLAVPGEGAFADEELRGEAKVVSGNEMVIGKRSVRLFGMAAPGLDEHCEINEAEMKCGIVAWAVLIKLADGRVVSCDVEPGEPKARAANNLSAKDEKGATDGTGSKSSEDAPGQKRPPGRAGGRVTLATCYIGEADLNEAMVRSGWAKAVAEETDRYAVDEADAKESRRGLWAGPKKRPRRKKK